MYLWQIIRLGYEWEIVAQKNYLLGDQKLRLQASHIWTVTFMPVTGVHLKAYISENKQKSQEKQQTFWDSLWITTTSKINGKKLEIQMISKCL